MDSVKQNQKLTERREVILSAAFEVFGNYGFRRTSMDDLAKAAGVSRPALYQSFANKNDIFRALLSSSLATACQASQLEIDGSKQLMELLDNLIDIFVLDPHRMLEALPHGEELLGLKAEIGDDIFDEWMQSSQAAYRTALEKEKSISPQLAEDLAAMLVNAIGGLKARACTVPDMEKELSGLKRVIMSSIK